MNEFVDFVKLNHLHLKVEDCTNYLGSKDAEIKDLYFMLNAQFLKINT
jgi:hypothetical protein